MRFQFIFYVELQPPEKSQPLFPIDPPIKIEILSRPPLPPLVRPAGRKRGRRYINELLLQSLVTLFVFFSKVPLFYWFSFKWQFPKKVNILRISKPQKWKFKNSEPQIKVYWLLQKNIVFLLLMINSKFYYE